jgi:hypothetical protein
VRWSALWALLAAVALWWPSRLSGPLDGAPLDTAAEAVLLGLAFPLLCWFQPSFLHRWSTRGLIVVLLAWKAATALLVVQDGWCVSVFPSRAYVRDQTGLPHSWDVRADWRSPNPRCTGIMTSAYADMLEFPVWFFNLPKENGDQPDPDEIPPLATTRLAVSGTLTAGVDGVLRVPPAKYVTMSLTVDGTPANDPHSGVQVRAGVHDVRIEMIATDDEWQLQPLWNERDLWREVTATTSSPSGLDLAIRPWGRLVTTVLAGALIGWWLWVMAAHAASVSVLAWMVTASAALAYVVLRQPEQRWHYAIAGLVLAAVVPVPPRLRNLFGAFLLIGVPWLVTLAAIERIEFGRMTLYTAGNDWWEFQRFAYRIFLQGYWLEGGEPTFWFQPFYRWIAGALHMIFGDSRIGEEFWDGVCLTIGALFCFHVVKVSAGFRWGVAAAALSLAVFAAGPGFIFVGHGLSEISSAGFIYLGALFALRSRNGAVVPAVMAGICATLAIWTRLNNFPMAAAIAVFAWPVREPARTLWRPRQWLKRFSPATAAIVAITIGVGLMLFAARTWYYTGDFSLFRGTALDIERGSARRVWQPGMSFSEGIGAMYDSVMMVLTTTDPPHIHNGSLPLIAGVLISIAALSGIALPGTLPLSLVLFCLSSLVGALLARGTAYPGRFSVHVIPAATAVLMCAAARAVSLLRRVPRRATAPVRPVEARRRP